MLFVPPYELYGSRIRETCTFLIIMNKMKYVKLHNFEKQGRHIKLCVLRQMQSCLTVIFMYLKYICYTEYCFF